MQVVLRNNRFLGELDVENVVVIVVLDLHDSSSSQLPPEG